MHLSHSFLSIPNNFDLLAARFITDRLIMSNPTQTEGIRVRPATLRDIDALATIMCEAMPMDRQWDYRYPQRKRFPEDHYGYTRLMMKSRLEDEVYTVDVATFPSLGLPEEDHVVAGLAISAVLQHGASAAPSTGETSLT